MLSCLQETKDVSNAVRAVKAQEAKFRGQGLTPGQAGKAAAAAALNQKGFTPKKSQKQKERDKKCAHNLTHSLSFVPSALVHMSLCIR